MFSLYTIISIDTNNVQGKVYTYRYVTNKVNLSYKIYIYIHFREHIYIYIYIHINYK